MDKYTNVAAILVIAALALGGYMFFTRGASVEEVVETVTETVVIEE